MWESAFKFAYCVPYKLYESITIIHMNHIQMSSERFSFQPFQIYVQYNTYIYCIIFCLLKKTRDKTFWITTFMHQILKWFGKRFAQIFATIKQVWFDFDFPDLRTGQAERSHCIMHRNKKNFGTEFVTNCCKHVAYIYALFTKMRRLKTL